MAESDWKPFVEYNIWGWVAGVQRKRWWGMQSRYAHRWRSGEWMFSTNPAHLHNPSREAAEQMALDAASKANDDGARNRRERYEVK